MAQPTWGTVRAGSVGVERQLTSAAALFVADSADIDADDPADLARFISRAGPEIAYTGRRLSAAERREAGVPFSGRRYLKRFRLLRKLDAARRRLEQAQELERLVRVSRCGLVDRLAWDDFAADPASAAFIARFAGCRTGRRGSSSDEISLLLLEASRNPWAVAHVYCDARIVRGLDGAQRQQLAAMWRDELAALAEALKALWVARRMHQYLRDVDGMMARRRDDSSSWNRRADAFNRVRTRWLHLAGDDRLYPGKVQPLLPYPSSHRSAAVDRHVRDVAVFRRLPLAWDVLAGRADCTRQDVETACRDAGVDAVASGWVVR